MGERIEQRERRKYVEVRRNFHRNSQRESVQRHRGRDRGGQEGGGQKNSALAGGGMARALEPLEGGKGLIENFIHGKSLR